MNEKKISNVKKKQFYLYDDHDHTFSFFFDDVQTMIIYQNSQTCFVIIIIIWEIIDFHTRKKNAQTKIIITSYLDVVVVVVRKKNQFTFGKKGKKNFEVKMGNLFLVFNKQFLIEKNFFFFELLNTVIRCYKSDCEKRKKNLHLSRDSSMI